VERKQGGRESGSADAGRYLGIGLTVALSTLLFLWLGHRADRWLGTEPWFTLIGVFVGAAAGFYHMYYHLVIAPRGRNDRRNGK
jgi:F0F1-type ATP synthase assembly protein I